MKYNLSKYIIVNKYGELTIQVVQARTYKDKRLFIYKNEDNKFVLVDEKTGIYVVSGKTLKELEDKWNQRKDRYEEVVKGKTYIELQRRFNTLKGERK